MNNKIIKIGVIGIGTVGSALINHLKSNKKGKTRSCKFVKTCDKLVIYTQYGPIKIFHY